MGPLTTFGVGGPARYFAEVRDEAELVEAVSWARERGLRVLPFGGGSNLLVGDRGFDGLAVRLGIGGEMGLREGAGWAEYDVPAGRDWDGFVSEVCRAGLSGVECLAGIPGMTGGTPIQNVGAYGQEVSETIVSVRAFDLRVGEFVEMGAAVCGFQYRGSVFNRAERGRYLVTRVRFRFHRGRVPELGYADLRRWFGEGARPSPTEVSEAVREIRAGKGMVVRAGDPDSRSAGSFFKNPVVGGAVLEKVVAETGVGAVPHWPGGEEGTVKLSAAWLVERAGFGKGFRMGGAGGLDAALAGADELERAGDGGGGVCVAGCDPSGGGAEVWGLAGAGAGRGGECGGAGLGFCSCVCSEALEEAGSVLGEDLCGGALGGDAAVGEAEDFGVEEEGFGDVVGYGEDGDAEAAGEMWELGEEVVAEVEVEAGERLVEQEEKCGGGDGGEEGPGDGDALFFSAAEVCGAVAEVGGELKEVEDLGEESFGVLWWGSVRDAVEEVFADGQVGEEVRGLAGAADGAEVGWGTEVSAGVDEGVEVSADLDLGVVGPEVAGEDAEDGAFAAAGGAEENGPGGGEGGVDVEGECALLVLEGEAEMGWPG